jgi:hypothetical protein
VGSIVWLVLVGSGLSSARSWTPTADLVVGAGHEDDLVLLDGPDGRVVPGGVFGEMRAAALATVPGDDGGHLRIGARGAWQRFLDADGRRLASGGLFTELRRPFHERWHVLVGARAGGYDDDSRPDVRRLDGGVHGSIGLSGSRWTLEAGAGYDGVRLPEFSVFDTDGSSSALSESAVSAHGALMLNLGRGVFARIDARGRDSDSVDPFYDADARSLGFALWLPAGGRGRLSLGGGRQVRHYVHRSSDADDDRWQHGGIGYEFRIDEHWRLMADAGFGEYRDTFGNVTDSRRVSISIGWRPWSRKNTPPPPTIRRESDSVLFRCHAPEAESVVLVGEFNGWDPGADPLAPAGGGWWELRRRIAPGNWQYAYLVDGHTVVPADADRLVPDGFGSRNGLINVHPDPVTSGEE